MAGPDDDVSSALPLPNLAPRDLVAGIGVAPRELLATGLALFDDSSLQQRLTQRVDRLKRQWTDRHLAESLDEAAFGALQRSIQTWSSRRMSDDKLRLLLWMRLRDAFGLPAVTFGSLRSAQTAADDLVAAALAFMRPGVLDKAKDWLNLGTRRACPASLTELATQTLDELIANAMGGSDPATAEARQYLVTRMKHQVQQLDADTRKNLLETIGATELNDQAIRTMLVTSGGMAAFGSAVSMAGFSAYILAAQASAFIPLVSGPALVSLVAVISNPITIALATVGGGLWLVKSTNQRVHAAIALRLLSLLALLGSSGGGSGTRRMARLFEYLPHVRLRDKVWQRLLAEYRTSWKEIKAAHHRPASLSPACAAIMERAVPGERLLRGQADPDRALSDMSVMTGWTLGEFIYHCHMLHPAVLAAADFSRLEDLNDPVAFAGFAHHVESMIAASRVGAVDNLKGYVAEQTVASQLASQGHLIEFPETANQAGWDLVVDGVKFQVKNASDLSLLGRHFEKGYEYPVLANAEVASLLAEAEAAGRLPEWAGQVHFVEGYSQAGVQQIQDATMEAGGATLHPQIPTLAMMLAAIHQWQRFGRGEVSGSQAIQDALINGSITAGLAMTGNVAGVAIGLLVFGPAGALVLGSALPILGRTQTERVRTRIESMARGRFHQEWEATAREKLERLASVLIVALQAKQGMLGRRVPNQASKLVTEYLEWRFDDEGRFLQEAVLRLAAIKDDSSLDVETAGRLVIGWLGNCTVHPAVYQEALTQWLEVIAKKPRLADNLDPYVSGAVDFGKRALASFIQRPKK